MAVHRVVAVLLLLLWLAADAVLLTAVVLDWWVEAQYIVATSPADWYAADRAGRREPEVIPRRGPAPAALAGLGRPATR